MEIQLKPGYVHIKPLKENKQGSIDIPHSYQKYKNFAEVIDSADSGLERGNFIYHLSRPAAILEDESMIIPSERVIVKKERE